MTPHEDIALDEDAIRDLGCILFKADGGCAYCAADLMRRCLKLWPAMRPGFVRAIEEEGYGSGDAFLDAK